ncbi:MAG: methyltransferase domain-containing protein, partial [Candidatus Nitrosocosmicus sp.]|nr:methyltransferase domain-containing protein [Candidatus Nitrosocosmicus sp.]
MNNSNQSIRERWVLGDYRSIGKVISPVSAKLVRLVNVKPVDLVLDVACGFGNTAITARRAGAKVTGIDITPELLAQAKEEESIAKVSGIDWREGNAESLPFENESFDIVLSTFGHMFASNQKATANEMQRVLKKGGRIGFATWPPELAWGRMYVTISKYVPPVQNNQSPPPIPQSPGQWGIPSIVQELLHDAKDIFFERDTLEYPILSPNHYWQEMATKSGSMIQLIRALENENKVEKIELIRQEYLKTIEPYI